MPPLIVVVLVELDGEMMAMVSPECRNWAESESIQQSKIDNRQHFFFMVAKVVNKSLKQ